MSKSIGVLQVRYRPIEQKYIEKFEESGYSMSDLVRQWIREKGSVAFPDIPLYAQVAAERIDIKKKEIEEKNRIKNMSPEEYVTEILKGKVRGNYAEFRGNHGEVIELSMFNIKDKTPENTDEITMHLKLVSRDYRYVNGEEPDWEKVFAGW